MKTLSVIATGSVLLLGISSAANATLQGWQSEVAAGTPAEFTETNITEPTTRDIGTLTEDKTYEFIVNASDEGISSVLIGVRDAAPNQAIKFEQYFNSMLYGLTQFGDDDYSFDTMTTFSEDVHLAFKTDSTSGRTTLYVNGNEETHLDFVINLSGIVGVGQSSDGTDPLDGVFKGIATYNSALSDTEIQRHSDAYFAPPIECVGFAAPLDKSSVTVKGKNRALPLKADLIDIDGNFVTDENIVASPVVKIVFSPTTPGDINPDDIGDYLAAGQGSDGNQFEFNGEKWQFNLKTKNHTAPGTYSISMTSGDETEYGIDPTCTVDFLRTEY